MKNSIMLSISSIKIILTTVCITLLTSCIQKHEEYVSLLSQQSKNKIYTIGIYSHDNAFPIILNKQESSWNLFFDDSIIYPAQNIVCEEIIEKFAIKRNITAIEYENLNLYGISINSSTIIEFLDFSDTLLEAFVLGERHSDQTSWYILRKSDSSLFRLSNELDDFYSLKTSDWLDLHIFSYIRSSNFISLEMQKNQKKYTLYNDILLQQFKKMIENIVVIDITNIPSIPEYYLQFETGTLKKYSFSISNPLNSVYILTITSSNASYIISEENFTNIKIFITKFI